MLRPLVLLGLVALGAAACVPADEALGLGSVQFTFTASKRTVQGVVPSDTIDGYYIDFDRVVLGFKTMTIGKVGVPETCSYRGRGAVTNVAFDPRRGLVQAFNGIQPVDCPDVGVIFGAPDDETVPAMGTSVDDLLALAEGGYHGIVDATATQHVPEGRTPRVYKLELRFEPTRTSTRFGGCREATRGVRILANKRDLATVRFGAESLFREALSVTARLRFAPFAQADAQGDNDHLVTMKELDALRLTSIFAGDFYQLGDGSRGNGTFGDFVRFLFRFTVTFRTEDGLCVGNEPGDGSENP